MQKGKNTIAVALTLEIINTVKEFASVEDQNEGFWIIKRLLTQDPEVKKRFLEKYGEEVYNETVKHYSKTNLEQRAERKLREEAQKIKDEARQKIEQLKAEAYAQQVKNSSPLPEKPESPEVIELKKRIEEHKTKRPNFLSSEYKPWFEENQKLEAKLKSLLTS